MRTVSVFVESGVRMAFDAGSAAWVFDEDLWGSCGQGTDEGAALRDLYRLLGRRTHLVVAERVRGDEQVFARDRVACTPAERARTLEILADTRRRTVDLVRSCSPAELDCADLNRSLPSFASWRTLREMAWHIVDTESRGYLPAAGLPARPRQEDLFTELDESARHVRAQLHEMPSDLLVEGSAGTWTAVKLLRRLAWHERGELTVMRLMLERLRVGRCA